MRTGELGEAAFLHKAMSLGFRVSKPFAVERYDFIVCHGNHVWRVQVKATGRRVRDLYAVGSAHRRALKYHHYRPSEIDFFAMYIEPEDTWYIIPAAVACFHTCLYLYSRAKCEQAGVKHAGRPGGSFEPYREAWHLLKGK